ncbi:hypothetical protein AVEN_164673-1 [Araneus ventricosus]|uniref:Uncharacterized protein n=1 Tax=Araneus ventricosus TaxID=182803 RepID=A0A4Y2SZH3_ARAVE|nr:hypothetical protein AVEN_232890-1 [Araneus ventricosus]GBN93030.1 hypothetical protein AVEN_201161-1 [Araneus ventricosus]GBN94976.1 hypothetical protein AVEN_134171-1 [Araneus ventricosus]GBN95009.1 hypothetical protein AVEN_164673-1 [Araneus ventricosus]
MSRRLPDNEPLSKFPAMSAGEHSTSADLTYTRPAYTTVLWWNRILNLEPSDPEAGILPPRLIFQRVLGFNMTFSFQNYVVCITLFLVWHHQLLNLNIFMIYIRDSGLVVKSRLLDWRLPYFNKNQHCVWA